MKLFSTARLRNILGAALLLVNLFGLGTLVATAQMDLASMGHPDVGFTGCQQKCSSVTTVVTAKTQEETKKEANKKNSYSYPLPAATFATVNVQRLVFSPAQDFRLLRPPDLLALYGIFRI